MKGILCFAFIVLVLFNWNFSSVSAQNLTMDEGLDSLSNYSGGELDPQMVIALFSKGIEEKPKDLEIRVHLLSAYLYSDSTYNEYYDRFTELRNEMFSNPDDWYLTERILNKDEFDKFLSEVNAFFVEGLAQNNGLADAERFVNVFSSRNLPDSLVQESFFQLSLSYADEQRYEEAIDILHKLEETSNEDFRPIILYNMAVYYSKLGFKAEALKYARMAEKEGDNERAPRLIADLERTEQNARYYDLVFQLLPRMLPDMGVSEVTAIMLVNPQNVFSYIKKRFNVVVDKDLSSVKGEIITSARGDIVVWTMPEPEKWTEPMYVAFVPDGDFYRFFTLEKTMDFEGKFKGDPYLLCGATYSKGDKMPSHFNTGDCVDGSTCTPEKFVEYIEDFLSR